MLILLSYFVALYLSPNGCGLSIPHQHLLLAGATEHDLDVHLNAESHCSAAHSAAPDPQGHAAQHHGIVLSIVNSDQNNTSAPVFLALAAVPPAELAMLNPAGIGNPRVEPAGFPKARPPGDSPPTPPPEHA